MKLLGKEVKVGTRVLHRNGTIAEITQIDPSCEENLPFCTKRGWITSLGNWLGDDDEPGAWDVVEVLDDEPPKVEPDHFAASEAELELYNLRVENEFLKQKVEELGQELDRTREELKEHADSADFFAEESRQLRASVEALATEVAALKDGQYAAMEQRCEELLISRDFWREKAETATAVAEDWRCKIRECVSRIERLEAVLKGTPAPRPPNPEEQEVMQWMQENSKLMDMLGDE